MQMCPAELQLQPHTPSSVTVEWRTLYPRQRGILHLGDASKIFTHGLLIGSAPHCAVRLAHVSIAKEHARFYIDPYIPQIHAVGGDVRIFGQPYPHLMKVERSSSQERIVELPRKDHTLIEWPANHCNTSIRILPQGKEDHFVWYARHQLSLAHHVSFPRVMVGCYLLRVSVSTKEAPEYFAQNTPSGLLLQANNPKTTARALEKLAEHPDPRIRRGVALNPNTSPKILRSLLEGFPTEVLDNPATQLMHLEDRSFFDGLQFVELLSLLEADLPEWFMRLIADNVIQLDDSLEMNKSYIRTANQSKKLTIRDIAFEYRLTAPSLLTFLQQN